MKHELTSEECTVDHSHWKGIDGDTGEPCRVCKHCRNFIRPQFTDEECTGKPVSQNPAEKLARIWSKH